MTDIDHYAEARQRIEDVNLWQETEGETDATCIALAIEAQTHAILALVGQQQAARAPRLPVEVTDEMVIALLNAQHGYDPYVTDLTYWSTSRVGLARRAIADVLAIAVREGEA